MNRIRSGRLAGVAAALLAATACNDNLTDINVDPNQPTTAPAPYVLSAGELGAVRRVLGENFHMTMTALWAQHFAKIQYIDEDRYALRPQTVDAHWSGFYVGPLADFAEVMEQGQAQGRPNYTAIADVMSVWTWQVMTDAWGDIPYSEALKGDIGQGNNVTPAYDRQADIYTSLLSRLATSQAALSAGGGNFGANDVIYQGDPESWRRFANSLRLRVAMRMVNRSPAAARSAFEAAAGLPLILANDQAADLDYGSTVADANPIYVNQLTRDDHAVSRTMVDSLKRLHDPRLGFYANPTPASGVPASAPPPLFIGPVAAADTSVYQGMRNGIAAGSDNNLPGRSRIGSRYTRAAAPAVLMSASEVYLLLAEARQRGWSVAPGVTVDSLYRHGIRLSMQEVGVPADAIENYLARPWVQLDAAGSTPLRQIHLQKWIALFGNGPEAFAEWRRTGVPGLTPAVNAPAVPVRVFYSTIEQSLNGANLSAAIGANGGDDLWDPVWWDTPGS